MENNTQNGQFELSGESASLQARQAAAFGYMKGYMSLHFKRFDSLTYANYRFMRQECIRLFGIELLEAEKEGKQNG